MSMQTVKALKMIITKNSTIGKCTHTEPGGGAFSTKNFMCKVITITYKIHVVTAREQLWKWN